MVSEVTYGEQNNIYQAVYIAEDERIAKWIADQYKDIGLKEEMLTMLFAYKRDVVLSSKSEEIAIYLRDKLNRELARIMAGIQEIDPEYIVKKCIHC